MNFARQVNRSSQKQELDLVQHTVQALAEENQQLNAEVKSLYRAMGAMVAVSGGEIKIPRDIDRYLAGKNLVSDVVGEDIVFRTVDAPVSTKEAATTE